jgi:CRISPR-associated protein Cas1
MEKIPLVILDKNRVITSNSNQVKIYDYKTKIRDCPIFKISDIVVHIDNNLKPNIFKTASKHQIPIHFINKNGKYYGSFITGSSKNIFLRELQYRKRLDENFRLAISKKFITGKYNSQNWLLTKYDKNLKLPEVSLIESAEDINNLLGIEGSIANVYWKAFAKLIKNEHFKFNHRSKNPPRDYVNSLLSYGYTLLTTRMISIILKVGLDPYFGFYHENNYRRPSLALDLMEEFRPIAVDKIVLNLINKRQLNPDDFENYFGIPLLKKSSRSYFIKNWLSWWFKEKFYFKSYKNSFTLEELAEIQARKLVKVLTKEIDNYEPLNFKNVL